MRFVLNLLLLIAIVSGLGYIVYAVQNEGGDIVVRESLTVTVSVAPEAVFGTVSGNRPNGAREEAAIDDDCFVWGPFDSSELRAVQPFLDRTGLMQRAEIVDRYLPDKWIVYLGRYDNDVAVKAFIKQFQQQGFKSVRPILRGNLAYGVEVAAFENRGEAEAYLASSKAPDMQGLRVTNRLGDPSDKVDIVFNGLSEDERRVLFKAWKSRSGTQLQSCSYYGR